MDLLDQPPHGLDVAGLEGDVGIVEVDPVADAPGQLVPVLLIARDARAAGGVERSDAVLLDLLAPVQTEFLLDLDLDRQTVRVPTALALDAQALERLVAAEGVLDRAPEHVVDAGAAVGGWRSFVEGERGRTVALGDALGESVFALPHTEHVGFECGQIERFALEESLGHQQWKGVTGTSSWSQGERACTQAQRAGIITEDGRVSVAAACRCRAAPAAPGGTRLALARDLVSHASPAGLCYR